jgi:hypothetical protein
MPWYPLNWRKYKQAAALLFCGLRWPSLHEFRAFLNTETSDSTSLIQDWLSDWRNQIWLFVCFLIGMLKVYKRRSCAFSPFEEACWNYAISDLATGRGRAKRARPPHLTHLFSAPEHPKARATGRWINVHITWRASPRWMRPSGRHKDAKREQTALPQEINRFRFRSTTKTNWSQIRILEVKSSY